MKTTIIDFKSESCKECKKNGFYNPIIYKEGLCNEHYDKKHADEGLKE